VFKQGTLVLVRGGGRPPIVVDKLPALGPVASFARVHMLEGSEPVRGAAVDMGTVSVPLRLAPDTDPWRNITAARVHPTQLGLLRQLCYRLGPRTLKETRVAFTDRGAFLLRDQGIESVPVGDFYRRVHPRIFVSAGYAPVPAVAPEVLHRAFGAPGGELIFLHKDGSRLGVPDAAFVSLEEALLDAQSWAGTTHESVTAVLTTELPRLVLDSPGFRPMRDVEPPEEGSPAG